MKDRAAKTRLLSKVIEYGEKRFAESREAQKYIRTAGIDVTLAKKFRVGYGDGTLAGIVAKDTSDYLLLQELGAITEGGKERMEGCIFFPLTALNQLPVNLYGRKIESKETVFMNGTRRGLFNWNAARNYSEIVLTNNAIEALKLIQQGAVNVIALTEGELTEDHADFLVRFGIKRVLLAVENANVENRLRELGIETGKAAIEKTEQKEILQLLSQMTPGSHALQIEERNYSIRGIPNKSGGNLRITLNLKIREKHYLDTVDLYSAQSRKRYAQSAGEHFNRPDSVLQQDLLTIEKAIRAYREQKQKANEPAEPPKMSEAETAKAIEFLKSENLLDNIAEDMEALGYVGEEGNKKLGYLIATSRKLEDPLSGVIQSQSGSGKSYLAELLIKLMPQEEVKKISRLTPAALFYMGQEELKGKFVAVEEKAGSEEADYSIRAFQSSKELILAVPVKNPDTGETRTKQMRIAGPAAFLETTAAGRINHENANRVFELFLNETSSQTEAIHKVQREGKTLEGRRRIKQAEKITKKHQNAQRLLQPITVINNYAPYIEFPASWLRTRRDHLRFLNLIEAIAFLNQYRKEKKNDEQIGSYIETDLQDYSAAVKLAEAVLSGTLSDLKKPAGDLLAEIEDYVNRQAQIVHDEPGRVSFLRRDIREATGLPNHRIKELFSELEELEYLEVEKGVRGGSYRYRLITGKKQEDFAKCLLTAEELQAKMRGEQ